MNNSNYTVFTYKYDENFIFVPCGCLTVNTYAEKHISIVPRHIKIRLTTKYSLCLVILQSVQMLPLLSLLWMITERPPMVATEYTRQEWKVLSNAKRNTSEKSRKKWNRKNIDENNKREKKAEITNYFRSTDIFLGY